MIPDLSRVAITCKSCGNDLLDFAQVDELPSPDWDWSLAIKPCEFCMAEAEAAGESAGRDEISEETECEIASLEATIDELNNEISELKDEIDELEADLMEAE